jgi:glycosyltransferase involved in cell wall biosynthesis
VNLLLVNYEYPPVGGGAANATRFIGRALADLGHRITVLTAAFGTERGWVKDEAVAVLRLDSLRKAPDRSNMREMLSFLRHALSSAGGIARERGIDGVITFFTLPCGPVGLLLRRMGIPYVVSLRGGDVPGLVPQLNLFHALVRPLRRMILRRAVAVIANSPSLAALSQEADPIPVAVIPNGVDAAFFQPAQRSATRGNFSLLFVGRLVEQKNLKAVLGAIARLRPRLRGPLSLQVVGDGPLRGELERLAQFLDVSELVTWHGWLNKARLLRLYQDADCFVNPSLYEGMPNTVLEAMACGLPVIASRIGGNDDLVVDGVTGFLFDLANEPTFDERLAILLGDRALAVRFGQAGRERVLERFSWRSVAQRYVEILRAHGK